VAGSPAINWLISILKSARPNRHHVTFRPGNQKLGVLASKLAFRLGPTAEELQQVSSVGPKA
jgi:hypothetical protein